MKKYKKKESNWSILSTFFTLIILFGVPLSALYLMNKEAFSGGVFIVIYIGLFFIIDDAFTFR